MTSVRVLLPIGEKTFPRCTADMFDRGVLTVTSIDDDAILEEMPPHRWLRARVLNEATGWADYEIENPAMAARAQSAA